MAPFHNGNHLYLSVVVFYNKHLTPRPPTSAVLVLMIIILEALITYKLRDDSFH